MRTHALQWALPYVLFVIVCGVFVYNFYLLVLVRDEVSKLTTALTEQGTANAQQIAEVMERIHAGEQRLTAVMDLVYTEQQRTDELFENIEGVDRTVGKLRGSVITLEKLATTDPQLLQKYSKVYFLNEHYIPTNLELIEERFDLVNGKQVSVHADMAPFLHDLLYDAWDAEVELMVLSGYRSFAEQATLKEQYTQRYGTGANQFSADQGYSEHQLGTAVDFTTTVVGERLAEFEQSEGYTWLRENAYRYGFVLSYPKGNSYYTYEPWHWRFVGTELATYLHKKKMHFYDMEQRAIDEYLPKLFD
jgi:LAS superfamily LD-carboxypeptidase LdcB